MIKGYIAITILLMMDFFAYIYNGISLAGQLSDFILFWAWLLITILISIRYFKRKWVKWNLAIIVFLIILSLIPMGIPFIMLTNFATDIKQEKEIENYRLREARVGFLLDNQTFKVVKNLGVLEIEIDDLGFGEDEENRYQLSDVSKIYLLKEREGITFKLIINGHSYKRWLSIDRFWAKNIFN